MGCLAEQFQPWLDDVETVVVPTSLQFEFYKWAKWERGEVQALEAVALTEQGMPNYIRQSFRRVAPR